MRLTPASSLAHAWADGGEVGFDRGTEGEAAACVGSRVHQEIVGEAATLTNLVHENHENEQACSPVPLRPFPFPFPFPSRLTPL
jgi:hypothetical protein